MYGFRCVGGSRGIPNARAIRHHGTRRVVRDGWRRRLSPCVECSRHMEGSKERDSVEGEEYAMKVLKETEQEEAGMFVDRVDVIVARTRAAQKQYAEFSQEEVDRIFKQAALEANMNRIPLAKLAVEETGIGLVEDKVIKNHFASEEIYNRYRDEKTCGVIEEDGLGGIERVAEPMGVLCGIVTTTNPTSTAIFKCLLALKTRNGIVLAPHPRASKCTIAAATIVHDAAVSAGAPPGIIGWIEHPSKDETFQLMKSDDISMIIATGGPGMVKASYSSGTPALGVGAGNTPAIIDSCADIHMAVNYILLSKTFDNGVICASEQAAVVLDDVYDQFRHEMSRRGGCLLSEEDTERVRRGLFTEDGRLNPDTVGKPAYELATLFGLEAKVDENTRLLVCPVESVGPEEVLSSEKLCPVLGLYRAP